MRTAGWKITFFFSFMYIIFLIGEIVPCENIVHNNNNNNNNNILQLYQNIMHAYSIIKSKTDGKLLTKTRLYEALPM